MFLHDSDGALCAPSHSPEPTPVALHDWPIKPCCGVLLGDECDCLGFAAEAKRLFEQPILLDLRTRPAVA